MRKLKCWAGFHRRSRSMTRYGEDDVLRSQCHDCRTPMLMTLRNTWIVDAASRETGRTEDMHPAITTRAGRDPRDDTLRFVRDLCGIELPHRR